LTLRPSSRPRLAQHLEGSHVELFAIFAPLAEHLELAGPIARADHHLEATLAQVLKHGEVFGEFQRFVEWGEQDVWAYGDPPGAPRDRTRHWNRGREISVIASVVLAEADDVEPQIVRPGTLIECGRVQLLCRRTEARRAHVVADHELHPSSAVEQIMVA